MSRSYRILVLALLCIGFVMPRPAYADDAEKADTPAADQKTADDSGTKPDGTAKEKAKPATRPAAKKTNDNQAKPTARKTKPKGPAKIPASVMANVQELKKEYELGKLRRTSDYFAATPNAELTPEVATALLQKRLGNSDSMDGYIKWQVLSALPSPMPEQVTPEATAAYYSAPGIQARPGMSKEDKRALDRDAAHVANPADLYAKVVNECRRVEILNEPVLNYREALFTALPDNADVFRAALQDLFQRGQAGITPRVFLQKVATRMTQWATSAQNMNEVRALHGMVDELASAEMPEYYDTIRPTRDDNGSQWNTAHANVNDNTRLNDISKALLRQLNTAAPTRDNTATHGRRPNPNP